MSLSCLDNRDDHLFFSPHGLTLRDPGCNAALRVSQTAIMLNRGLHKVKWNNLDATALSSSQVSNQKEKEVCAALDSKPNVALGSLSIRIPKREGHYRRRRSASLVDTCEAACIANIAFTTRHMIFLCQELSRLEKVDHATARV